MSDVIVFTGAGASCHFGLPVSKQLTDEIVDAIVDNTNVALLRGGSESVGGESRSSLRSILRSFLVKAYPGIGKYRDERPSITDMLSLVDHSLKTGTAHPFRGVNGVLYDMHDVRRAFEICILDVIARYSATARRNTDRKKEIQDLKRAIDALCIDRSISLISTNYDTILDDCWYSLTTADEDKDDLEPDTDLGTGFRTRFSTQGTVIPRNTRVRKKLYKLHGSLNWLKCSACEQLYMSPTDESIMEYGKEIAGSPGLNDCHCNHAPLRHLIVSPSYVRDVRDTVLQEIWRSAQEAMRTADTWMFVGYSLPAEDVAIRSMIQRAFISRNHSKRKLSVHVYDVPKEQDKKPSAVEIRYRTLLESESTEFRFHAKGMADFIPDFIGRNF